MKYIVYKTTNKINNNIYIGVHGTKNPEVFDGYIGCGVNIHIKDTYINPKTKFQRAVYMYGIENFNRQILLIFDNPKDAYQLESQLVNYDFLKRDDVYNMVPGGRTNEKKVYKYDLSGNYICGYKSMSLAAISINKTNTGIKRSMEFKFSCGGYYWSYCKLNTLDISDYNTTESLLVYSYDSVSGEYSNKYKSISSAACMNNATIIQVSRSAKMGYRVGNLYFSFIKANNICIAMLIYYQNRKVYKYDGVSGDFICGYQTLHNAEIENPLSDITRSIKNKKPCNNGFRWSLEKFANIKLHKNSIKKPVGKFDLNGNLLQIWPSVKACINETKITKALITHEKIYNNYIYKHISNFEMDNNSDYRANDIV